MPSIPGFVTLEGPAFGAFGHDWNKPGFGVATKVTTSPEADVVNKNLNVKATKEEDTKTRDQLKYLARSKEVLQSILKLKRDFDAQCQNFFDEVLKAYERVEQQNNQMVHLADQTWEQGTGTLDELESMVQDASGVLTNATRLLSSPIAEAWL